MVVTRSPGRSARRPLRSSTREPTHELPERAALRRLQRRPRGPPAAPHDQPAQPRVRLRAEQVEGGARRSGSVRRPALRCPARWNPVSFLAGPAPSFMSPRQVAGQEGIEPQPAVLRPPLCQLSYWPADSRRDDDPKCDRIKPHFRRCGLTGKTTLPRDPANSRTELHHVRSFGDDARADLVAATLADGEAQAFFHRDRRRPTFILMLSPASPSRRSGSSHQGRPAAPPRPSRRSRKNADVALKNGVTAALPSSARTPRPRTSCAA